MFTLDDFIFSSITHTALHNAKLQKLQSENFILPKNIFDIVGTKNALFYIDDDINTIKEVMTEYNFNDLRPTDNVLDIGACIGAFSLSVHKKVNHVYATEPLMTDALIKNIILNNAKNITVLDYALANGPVYVSWNGKTDLRYGLALQQISSFCGGHIDFLKLDCEGGEYSIKFLEIMNIRRIEAEVHNSYSYRFKDFENTLTSAGFDYTKKMTNRSTMLISAKNRYID